MRVYDLIAKKRDGGTHSREELEQIVNGYVSGEVTDYQMAAWMTHGQKMERELPCRQRHRAAQSICLSAHDV